MAIVIIKYRGYLGVAWAMSGCGARAINRDALCTASGWGSWNVRVACPLGLLIGVTYHWVPVVMKDHRGKGSLFKFVARR